MSTVRESSADQVEPGVIGYPYPNASEFDFGDYLLSLDKRLLAETPGRHALCRMDPLAFALTYLPHHMMGEETGMQVTFGDAHLHWIEQAKRWATTKVTEPAQMRDAYIAPRNMGKSTWWFTILPLWAAAFGHVKFIAAFADSATQAEEHLSTFKSELETNELLRQDFPQLCAPAKRQGGAQKSDNKAMYQAANGFTFAARGIDSGNLGMKVGTQRPDLLIMDDIEPGEANYSPFQMQKRLSTIQNVVLQLNVYARVVIVGTVTMPGSIIHQLVKSARGLETEQWITAEKIHPHYYAAIIDNHDGTERSIWPAKWDMDYLLSIRDTRTYLMNYANDPMGADGPLWAVEDFNYTPLSVPTHRLISIDPAVTNKASSDFTGIAIVSYSSIERRAQVEKVYQLHIKSNELRQFILNQIANDPNIGLILVETNQGGDVWKNSILHDMPVKVVTVHQTVKKEVRAAAVHNLYQRGVVSHVPGLTTLEEQMISFPNAPHDDMVDAVGSGIAFFAKIGTAAKKALTKGRSVERYRN